jgi:hypothetical protein
MYLTKEIYRDAYYSTRREIFYNDKKQVTALLETSRTESGESGNLSVYDYSGENYRITKYDSAAKSYAAFINRGHKILGEKNWHSPAESGSVQQYKYENGQLIAEDYVNTEYGTAYSLTYVYENGLKVREIKTSDDGTVTRTEFQYENGKLQFKVILINDQFGEQITYVYGNDQLLKEEQRIYKHESIQYPAFSQQFFYNEQKEVERTEYYGRYNSGMFLYKVDEAIRSGDILGYYDMQALHSQLKTDNMEWAIEMCTSRYFETNPLYLVNHTVEKYDDKNHVIHSRIINPETGQTLGEMVYRNEYNEQSLLEFVISYRTTDEGKIAECDIRKFYYCE